MREETEWVETVALGRNHLAGSAPDRIRAAFDAALSQPVTANAGVGQFPYGTGDAATRIEACLATGL
jgi:UDP-N-acetylglucosamine 2-epimerase